MTLPNYKLWEKIRQEEAEQVQSQAELEFHRILAEIYEQETEEENEEKNLQDC